MKSANRKQLHRILRTLFRREGQDLVEYALVVALLAFGAAAGMKSLATGLSNAFSNVGAYLVSNTN